MTASDKVNYFLDKSFDSNNEFINLNNINFNKNNKIFTILNNNTEYIKVPTFFIKYHLNLDKINSLNSSINFILNESNVITTYKTLESVFNNMIYNNSQLSRYSIKNCIIKVGKGLILNNNDEVLFMVESIINKSTLRTDCYIVYINKIVFNNKNYLNDFIANKIYKKLVLDDNSFLQDINKDIIITNNIPCLINLDINEDFETLNDNCNNILNQNKELLIESLKKDLIYDSLNNESIPF